MLRFIDSFDHYAAGDITEKWTGNNGMITSAGNGRRGTASLRQSIASGTQNIALTLDAQGTWILGFAFRYTSPPSNGFTDCTLAQWLDVGTIQASLRLGLDACLYVQRGGTRLVTAGHALHANVFYYVEWRLVISVSAGETEIRIDGVTAASGTGLNTQESAMATANNMRLGQFGGTNSTAGAVDIDDLYLCDGQGGGTFATFLGDCRVDALYPNADGTHTAWTPSAGAAHYAVVEEHPPNDDTDYVSATTGGARDSYQLEPLPTMPNPTVLAVQAVINARKDDVDEILIRPLLVSGATTSVASTAQALSSSYKYVLERWTTDPAGGAWTEAAVNTLQVGMERSA